MRTHGKGQSLSSLLLLASWFTMFFSWSRWWIHQFLLAFSRLYLFLHWLSIFEFWRAPERFAAEIGVVFTNFRVVAYLQDADLRRVHWHGRRHIVKQNFDDWRLSLLGLFISCDFRSTGNLLSTVSRCVSILWSLSSSRMSESRLRLHRILTERAMQWGSNTQNTGIISLINLSDQRTQPIFSQTFACFIRLQETLCFGIILV